MRILKLTAENVKKLKTVEITPSGDVVQITGANGSGKSSVLDAIYWALAGKTGITSLPVRVGEERAVITLDLGEITVIRRFGKDGYTSLAVEANGAEYKSPQAMLDRLLGALTFDPLEFARMPQKGQLAELRRVVKVDANLEELARLNEEDFAKRTVLNRGLKSLEAQRQALGPVPDTPPILVDTSPLLEQLTNASDHNAEVDAQHRNRGAAILDMERYRAEAQQNRAEAARLLALVETQESKAAALEVDIEIMVVGTRLDATAVRADLDAANAQNEIAKVAIATCERAAEIGREMRAVSEQVTALTDAMAARTQARTAAIAAAQFPVEGLSFGEEGVVYNGVPFDQASSAEQLRVSVALAMAANPTLRVLRIKDGSLLDEHSLAMIATMAHEQDYQVWIESVDTSGKIGIVMEDGEVRGAVAVEVEP
jgi:ABC-type cobalamin/Fe3+-siderophores transport system ATPase subunit